MINLAKLDSLLIIDERLMLRPYDDKTGKPVPPGGTCQGNLTTGVGHNLDGKPLTPAQQKVIGHNGRTLPITHDQAIWLLHQDEVDAMHLCDANCSWWTSLDDVRARVMVGLMFNMGWGTLKQFHHFLADMACKSFTDAADDLKNSAWYNQVGERGPRYVNMVRTGNDPTA